MGLAGASLISIGRPVGYLPFPLASLGSLPCTETQVSKGSRSRLFQQNERDEDESSKTMGITNAPTFDPLPRGSAHRLDAVLANIRGNAPTLKTMVGITNARLYTIPFLMLVLTEYSS